MRDQLLHIHKQLEKINAAPILKRAAMAQHLVGDVVQLLHTIADDLDELDLRILALEEKQ